MKVDIELIDQFKNQNIFTVVKSLMKNKIYFFPYLVGILNLLEMFGILELWRLFRNKGKVIANIKSSTCRSRGCKWDLN